MEKYPWQKPEQKKAEEEDSGSEILARAVGTVVGIAAAVGTAAYGLASLFASRSEEPAETSRKAHGNLSAPNKETWTQWWSQESLGVSSSEGIISAGSPNSKGGGGSATPTPGGVGWGAPSTTGWIGWQPPEDPWYKLNTDGTWRPNQGFSGAGGLIRDYNGDYLVGFCVKMKLCEPSLAEWWGAYHGLDLAWDTGFKRIILEIDNEGVAYKINEIIKRKDWKLYPADTPMGKIQHLLRKDWEEVKVIPIPGKVNKCADRLATMALEENRHLVVEQPLYMEQPPPDKRFKEVLSEDSNGVSAT